MVCTVCNSYGQRTLNFSDKKSFENVWGKSHSKISIERMTLSVGLNFAQNSFTFWSPTNILNVLFQRGEQIAERTQVFPSVVLEIFGCLHTKPAKTLYCVLLLTCY